MPDLRSFDTCQNMRIKQYNWLVATTTTHSGQEAESEIDLNEFIGMGGVKAYWGGRNLSLFSTHLRMDGTVLQFTMVKMSGPKYDPIIEYEDGSINLKEHIWVDHEGKLVYVS
ncbi:hypothetical protein RSOLAG1IB_10030 [Rhizoctonia solani AG-1 IB]|uniref:Cyanovirin-N domain-containing protein n=1 Tax=Thanatephorus cucumeris (strain AG1-IB / isolate 7/3/14) TaxID=1108050 RepID=A0A0B7FYW0_THACB|nr:hypothetical protein RSOLAG1IB_10030 [Rhizoctonia solani AG-1 IB]